MIQKSINRSWIDRRRIRHDFDTTVPIALFRPVAPEAVFSCVANLFADLGPGGVPVKHPLDLPGSANQGVDFLHSLCMTNLLDDVGKDVASTVGHSDENPVLYFADRKATIVKATHTPTEGNAAVVANEAVG